MQIVAMEPPAGPNRWYAKSEISADRDLSPLYERMEWDRLVSQLYRQLRHTTSLPGMIMIYELAQAVYPDEHAQIGRRYHWLVMQLFPLDQLALGGEVVAGIMSDEWTVWGVSSLIEGHMDRLDNRRKVPARVYNRGDLGAYMQRRY